jgi:cell division protein FtsQ
LLACSVGAYVAARDTSLFALRSLSVSGGTPGLRAAVKSALGDELGRSLLRIDGATIERRLGPIAGVRGFTYDRAFPHTLRIVVRRERAVLVVRQGDRAFLVASTGRVLRSLQHVHRSNLPRVWVTKDVHITVGAPAPTAVTGAATALAALRGAPLPGGVRFVRGGARELTLISSSGLELRLGDTGDLLLKLAIARRILRTTGAATAGEGYLDVSVPERPVLWLKSQVVG